MAMVGGSEMDSLLVSLRARMGGAEFEMVSGGESCAVVFAVRCDGVLSEFVKIDSSSAADPVRTEYRRPSLSPEGRGAGPGADRVRSRFWT